MLGMLLQGAALLLAGAAIGAGLALLMYEIEARITASHIQEVVDEENSIGCVITERLKSGNYTEIKGVLLDEDGDPLKEIKIKSPKGAVAKLKKGMYVIGGEIVEADAEIVEADAEIEEEEAEDDTDEEGLELLMYEVNARITAAHVQGVVDDEDGAVGCVIVEKRKRGEYTTVKGVLFDEDGELLKNVEIESPKGAVAKLKKGMCVVDGEIVEAEAD